MNWYKVAQKSLEDVMEQYYSFSFPTPFSADASEIFNSAVNAVLKENGAVSVTLRDLYGDGADKIIDAVEDNFDIPFAKDIIDNNTIFLVDKDGPERDYVEGVSGKFLFSPNKVGMIVLPARYDEDTGVYYVIGLATAIHEVVHYFDHLLEVKYSVKNKIRKKWKNWMDKIIKRIEYSKYNINTNWLRDYVTYILYMDLEDEKKAQEIALSSFFSALMEAEIEIPSAQEFGELLSSLAEIDTHYRASLLPIWHAYNRLQGQKEGDPNA